MRAARIYAAATVRRSWRALFVLALLVGLIGAVTVATLAGARRTSSAFDRFKDETRTADLTIFGAGLDAAGLAELRAFPGVETVATGRQLTTEIDGGFASVGAPTDDGIGRTIDVPRVLEGRLPRQDRASEVAIPEPRAAAAGLEVGDTIELETYSPEDTAVLAQGDPREPSGPEVQLRIVGITRAPSDLSIEGQTGGLLFTTRAFGTEYGDQIGSFIPNVLRVRVESDEDIAPVVRAARRLLTDDPDAFGVQPLSETVGGVQESLDVVTTALLVVAGLAALVGLVILSLAVSRFVDRGGEDLVVLRALGLSRAERTAALTLPLVITAVTGAVIAVVVALLASPLMPLGLARDAEPDPGFDLDRLVLGAGLAAIVLVVIGVAALASAVSVRREARDPTDEVAATRLGRAASVDALRPPIAAGLRLALQRGQGRAATPLPSAVLGTVLAIAGIVAASVFGASLAALDGTPAAYGYNWDAHVYLRPSDDVAAGRPCSGYDPAIVDDPVISGVATLCSVTVSIADHSTNAVGIAVKHGRIEPTVIDGRAPRAPDEAALGTDTLAATHLAIGDRVAIAEGSEGEQYRIVGTVVLPSLSADDSGNPQAIADGVLLTGRGADRIFGDPQDSYPILLRWRDGIDDRAGIAHLRERTELLVGDNTTVPLEVDRLDQLDALPWALGGFFALIGVLGIGYAVVVTVHRRAGDLAILKTIGFRRAQVMETVATQATALGAIGLVLGIPIGLIVGRLVWSEVGRGAGIETDATMTVSVLALVGVVALALLAINLVAFVPARRAARLRPAVVLRSE